MSSDLPRTRSILECVLPHGHFSVSTTEISLVLYLKRGNPVFVNGVKVVRPLFRLPELLQFLDRLFQPRNDLPRCEHQCVHCIRWTRLDHTIRLIHKRRTLRCRVLSLFFPAFFLTTVRLRIALLQFKIFSSVNSHFCHGSRQGKLRKLGVHARVVTPKILHEPDLPLGHSTANRN